MARTTQEQRYAVWVAEYMKGFQCTASACEDTCCAGWRVEIDHHTHRKYKRSQHPELRPLFERKIKRIRSKQSEVTYGIIEMNADGLCPFLSPQKLCRIQLALGEEALSIACAGYPRVMNIVDGHREVTGTVSCPEVARLALLNPNGIRLIEREEAGAGLRADVSWLVKNTATAPSTNLKHYFKDIRSMSIQMLQDRRYTLEERLLMLGLFIRRLDRLERISPETVSEVIRNQKGQLDQGYIREEIKKIPRQYTRQVQLLQQIAKEAPGVIPHAAYLECLRQALTGLGLTEMSTVEAAAGRVGSLSERYAHLLGEYAYVLENYLVNLMYQDLFPFGQTDRVFDEYVGFVTHYVLVKMHLIGLAAFNRRLSDDIVINLLYSLARAFAHDTSFRRNVFELWRKNGLDSLAFMMVLIGS